MTLPSVGPTQAYVTTDQSRSTCNSLKFNTANKFEFKKNWICVLQSRWVTHVRELPLDDAALKLWFCCTVTSSLNSWYSASSDLLLRSWSGSKNWSTLYCHWSPIGGQLHASDQSSIPINESIIYTGLFYTLLDQHGKIRNVNHLAAVDAANTTQIKLLLIAEVHITAHTGT